jgi:hypothetical protein
MANPNDPVDPTRPVVLQEPPRELAPRWQTSDKAPLPGADPVWSDITEPGETPLWQGNADPRLAGGALQKPGNLALFVLGLFGVFALSNGAGPGILVVLFAAAILILRQARRAKQAALPGQARYLLTDRAAYIARVDGQSVTDVRRHPITPDMKMAVGRNAITFATRYSDTRGAQTEGFIGIADAARVHALIRDIQKGQS